MAILGPKGPWSRFFSTPGAASGSDGGDGDSWSAPKVISVPRDPGKSTLTDWLKLRKEIEKGVEGAGLDFKKKFEDEYLTKWEPAEYKPKEVFTSTPTGKDSYWIDDVSKIDPEAWDKLTASRGDYIVVERDMARMVFHWKDRVTGASGKISEVVVDQEIRDQGLTPATTSALPIVKWLALEQLKKRGPSGPPAKPPKDDLLDAIKYAAGSPTETMTKIVLEQLRDNLIKKDLKRIAGRFGEGSIDRGDTLTWVEKMANALQRVPELRIEREDVAQKLAEQWSDTQSKALSLSIRNGDSLLWNISELSSKSEEKLAEVEEAQRTLTPKPEHSPERQLDEALDFELMKQDEGFGAW